MDSYCHDCGCTRCCCATVDRLNDVAHEGRYPWNGKTLDQVKQDHLMGALIFFNGNRSETSRALGISIRTVRNMISYLREEEPEIYKMIPLSQNEGQHVGNWRGYAQT